MTQVITVYPVPGRLILMPDRGFQPVPAEGADVARDSFYTRALLHGDLTETPPQLPGASNTETDEHDPLEDSTNDE